MKSLMEKVTHRQGVLHRAFNVFVFNSEMDAHPQALESTAVAACGPTRAAAILGKRPWWEQRNDGGGRDGRGVGWNEFSFIYRADLDHGMIEHELDHVLIGYSDVPAEPNPEEVCEVKYIGVKALEADIAENPDNYTAWFKICFPEVVGTLLHATR